jgi:hypothetical protein
MATEKNTGAVTFKKSGKKTTIELIVPTGTRLRDVAKIASVVKVGALRKFNPGGCLACTSGDDFRIRELARVLPADFATKPRKNMAAVDLKTGKLIG